MAQGGGSRARLGGCLDAASRASLERKTGFQCCHRKGALSAWRWPQRVHCVGVATGRKRMGSGDCNDCGRYELMGYAGAFRVLIASVAVAFASAQPLSSASAQQELPTGKDAKSA